jgi:cytochrome c
MVVGVLLAVAATGAVAQAPPGPDLVRGKRQFLQCVACHDLKSGGPAKVGPNLEGIFGRKAGTVAGLVPPSAQIKSSGIVWTDDVMDKWLEKPSNVVPGTLMAFAGMLKPEDRLSLIAYMKQETAPAGAAK